MRVERIRSSGHLVEVKCGKCSVGVENMDEDVVFTSKGVWSFSDLSISLRKLPPRQNREKYETANKHPTGPILSIGRFPAL